MSWIELAIALSGTTILRRCTSCMRSFSSTSWRSDLLLQPVEDILRHRQAGGQSKQPGAVVHIGVADDVAIHHRDDPHGMCRRRRGRHGAPTARTGQRHGKSSSGRSRPVIDACGSMTRTPATQSALYPNCPIVLKVNWISTVVDPWSPLNEV